MFSLREYRRRKHRSRPFAEKWARILARNIPRYHCLPPADREELEEHIQVFLAEKRFEGAAGLVITDEIRVTIAAQACMLLLHRDTDYYPGLSSIIVYPHEYFTRHTERAPGGFVHEGKQARLGESSTRGAVVLSWDHARAGASDVDDCRNVVFHEFAHQLDAEDGRVDGVPLLPQRSSYIAWARILGKEYEQLRQRTARGYTTLLDRYAATNPAEFFAVATECFFQSPVRMSDEHPELYEELKAYYRQDPAAQA